MDFLTKQNKIFLSLIILIIFATVSNQFIAMNMMKSMVMGSAAKAVELSGDSSVDAQLLVFSQGMPHIYGAELGMVSYPDPRDVQAIENTIDILKQFDAERGGIELTGENLERYIKLGTIPTIACEFCCSIKTLIHKSGERACGCAHSYAMRGLMKYLILNHGAEFTDDEILQEIIRWKAIYFPKQMMKRYIEQSASGEFTPDMAALLYNSKIKKGAKVKTMLPSEAIDNLPSMAGGC